MLVRKSTDNFRPKRITDVAQTKIYRPQFQKATLSNIVLNADGSVTESVSKSPAVQNSTLNPYARENYVKIVADPKETGISDAVFEAIATAFMVGKNLIISDEIVGGSVVGNTIENASIDFKRATTLSFHMLGQLNDNINRSNLVKSPTIPIDSGRQFDIVQLPYSTQNALALVSTPLNTPDSVVLKDLKDSLKIIWSNGSSSYNIYIGRCKSTLTDAYTPFDGLRTFFIDEEATINLNS